MLTPPCTHHAPRYDLGDGTYLVAPADIPFAAMRASHLLICDDQGTVLRGEGGIDEQRFQVSTVAPSAEWS